MNNPIKEHEKIRHETTGSTVQFGYRIKDGRWVAHIVNRYGVSFESENFLLLLDKVNLYITAQRKFHTKKHYFAL